MVPFLLLFFSFLYKKKKELSLLYIEKVVMCIDQIRFGEAVE